MISMNDTIVARATPPGEGAIAIIRISGPATLSLIEKCFQPNNDASLRHNYLTLGCFVDPDDAPVPDGASVPDDASVIDEVFCVLFKKPHSYTGEDAAEIHCHGGSTIVARGLDVLCRLGARMAQPGEFTKRAFLNGKIDLTRAEAVCDLIRSQTQKAATLALRQLQGKLSHKLKTMRQDIVMVSAEIEARLDFPEEELGAMDTSSLLNTIDNVLDTLGALIREGIGARIYQKGARIVLAGKPNTGKSSLFNTLLGRERAIVTPHPGTTRDSIEGTADLSGYPVTYVDTAGLRKEAAEIEKLGIARTESEVARADLILFLIDNSIPLDSEDYGILQQLGNARFLLVINKIDLPEMVNENAINTFKEKAVRIIRASALTGEGIDLLEQAMAHYLLSDTAASEDALVTNERHIELLRKAAASLKNARDGIAARIPEELVMVDIRQCLNTLGQTTGEYVNEEILDNIFSRFCIGK